MLILLIPSLWIQIAINRKAGKSCPRDKVVLSKQLRVRGSAVKTHTISLKEHYIEYLHRPECSCIFILHWFGINDQKKFNITALAKKIIKQRRVIQKYLGCNAFREPD